MAKDLTTIQLTKTVREQLKKLGLKGETYDAIIRRLIKLAESSMEGEGSPTYTTKVSEHHSEIQQIAKIENLFKDIHKKFRGKFKDWKEEDHEADKLLLHLAKEEEPHENH
ncbi:MAG: DUF7557 family protein [Candidatus Jordarchaeum sp.]|uniref:DUF7557 family protein n=1 Tax=Candidatus Jordarchaeum sp. TaxID=2823881 RepID=UPI00404B5B7E